MGALRAERLTVPVLVQKPHIPGKPTALGKLRRSIALSQRDTWMPRVMDRRHQASPIQH